MIKLNHFQESIDAFELSQTGKGTFDVNVIFEILDVKLDVKSLFEHLLREVPVLKWGIGDDKIAPRDNELRSINFFINKNFDESTLFNLLSKRSLDYLTGELFRFGTIKTPLKTYLYYQAHHIIVDGGSQKVIKDVLINREKGENSHNTNHELAFIENNTFLNKQAKLLSRRAKSYADSLTLVPERFFDQGLGGYCLAIELENRHKRDFHYYFNKFAQSYFNFFDGPTIIKVVTDLRQLLPHKYTIGNYVNTLPILLNENQNYADELKSKFLYSLVDMSRFVNLTSYFTFNFYEEPEEKITQIKELKTLDFTPRGGPIFSLDVRGDKTLLTLRSSKAALPLNTGRDLLSNFVDLIGCEKQKINAYYHDNKSKYNKCDDNKNIVLSDSLRKKYQLLSEGGSFQGLTSVKRILIASMVQKSLGVEIDLSLFLKWNGDWDDIERFIAVQNSSTANIYLFPDFSGAPGCFSESLISSFNNLSLNFIEYKENIDIQKQADLILKSIDENSNNIVLIGYSYGGLVAFEVKKRLLIESKLILLDSRILRNKPDNIQKTLKELSIVDSSPLARSCFKSYIDYSLEGCVSNAIIFKSMLNVDREKDQNVWRNHVNILEEIELQEDHVSLLSNSFLIKKIQHYISGR